MKWLFYVLLITGMTLTFSACSKGDASNPAVTSPSEALETPLGSDSTASSDSANTAKSNKEDLTICITIGDKKCTAIFYDNPTAHAFLEHLPLTVEMQELNGNEKYYHFSDKLPTDIESVGNIKEGDLMLYQDDYLVLFYESHTTSYSYTRIGYIGDTTGLADSVGNGNITASFRIENDANDSF